MTKTWELQSSENEQTKELTEELPLVTKLKKLSSSLTTIEVPISPISLSADIHPLRSIVNYCRYTLIA